MPATINRDSIGKEIKIMRSMLIIAGLAVFFDQLTKVLVRRAVAFRGTIRVIDGWFHLTYAENSGMAFGMLRGWNPVFIFVSIFAIVFIFIYYKQFRSNGWMRASLGLLLGGAMGNLVDRVIFGHVTDFIRVRWWFINYRWWPSFNIADACICVGAAMLIIGMFERSKSMEHRDQVEAANYASPKDS